MQAERPYQLTRDLNELSCVLGRSLMDCCTSAAPTTEDVLDTFLLAAGISQILDDYRNRNLPLLVRLAARMRRRPWAIAQLAAGALAPLEATIIRGRAAVTERHLGRLRDALTALLAALADAVIGGTKPGISEVQARSMLHQLSQSPAALRASVLVLPQCFFAFDMKPEDLGKLVERLIQRWPNRNRPIGVVGIRTSGSYLSPLVAAHLRSAGYRTVHTLSYRPRQPWLQADLRLIREIGRKDGLILVTDDPPTTGTTIATAAAALEHVGLPSRHIVLLLQLFDSPDGWTWPTRLKRYPQVVLRYSEWSIHSRLSEPLVGSALANLRGGQNANAISVRRLSLDPAGASPRSVRRRVRARYQVESADPDGGRIKLGQILVQGMGLGYFGRAEWETAARLREFVPTAFGVSDGLLFRAWIPEAQSVIRTGWDDGAVQAFASYLRTRAKRLPLPNDLSQRIAGRDAMWQRCSDLLTPAFGTLAPVARSMLQGVFKWLTRPSSPSLIDGRMEARHWLTASKSRRLPHPLKVDFAEGAYWSGIAYCADATYDMASAMADRDAAAWEGGHQPERSLERSLVGAGKVVPEERWLLHQLLYLRELQVRQVDAHQVHERAQPLDGRPGDVSAGPRAAPQIEELLDVLGPKERHMSRLLNGYLGKALASDVRPRETGPLCAIDLDGVLETANLGFAATTPGGLVALRALKAHGYRVILASGRSAAEVEERCRAYNVSGGVAEYGSAIFVTGKDQWRVLLSSRQVSELAHVKDVLGKIDGVYIDPAYRASVRAFRIRYGARCGLDWSQISLALAQASVIGMMAVQGKAQTDFVAAGIDKEFGLGELIRELEPVGLSATRALPRPSLTLAVGDSAADWPMLRMAAKGFAVANADEVLRKQCSPASAVRLLRGQSQAGLRQAVGQLLGHRPGSCQVCRPPRFSTEASVLMMLLGAQEHSRFDALRAIMRLRREARSQSKLAGVSSD